MVPAKARLVLQQRAGPCDTHPPCGARSTAAQTLRARPSWLSPAGNSGILAP